MPRILLVNKDHSLRKAVWLLLVKMGYDVVEAANGIEAEKLQRYLPADTLMTDIDTPPEDGLETIACFRKQHPQVRIIATSGRCAADICQCLRPAFRQGFGGPGLAANG